MTEQDKTSIFDIVIKPFLCPVSNNEVQGSENLFAEAIRSLINMALLVQRDAHLGCEQYERSADRNGQRNGFSPRTIRKVDRSDYSRCASCAQLRNAFSTAYVSQKKSLGHMWVSQHTCPKDFSKR